MSWKVVAIERSRTKIYVPGILCTYIVERKKEMRGTTNSLDGYRLQNAFSGRTDDGIPRHDISSADTVKQS